jgi:hypothetical protein
MADRTRRADAATRCCRAFSWEAMAPSLHCVAGMAAIIGAVGAIVFGIFWFIRRRRGLAHDDVARNARSGDNR